ncbi:hypothetical protein HanIR_Chr07g0303171 [Helianthus annuus]|nr:hypothetical protein HanIR_Chr07g0303171 [Helianthus annuus]
MVRSMTELGGFRNNEINDREFLQSQMILKMYHHPYGPNLFKVEKRRSEGGAATAGITLNLVRSTALTLYRRGPHATSLELHLRINNNNNNHDSKQQQHLAICYIRWRV